MNISSAISINDKLVDVELTDVNEENIIELLLEIDEVQFYTEKSGIKFSHKKFDCNYSNHFHTQEWVDLLMEYREVAKESYISGANQMDTGWSDHAYYSITKNLMENPRYEEEANYAEGLSRLFKDEAIRNFLKSIYMLMKSNDFDHLFEDFIKEWKGLLVDVMATDDDSNYYDGIPKNAKVEMVYIPNIDISQLNDHLTEFNGNAPGIESIHPNRALRSLLELANISAKEYKEFIKDVYLLDLESESVSEARRWELFNNRKAEGIKDLCNLNDLVRIINGSKFEATPMYVGHFNLLEILELDPTSTVMVSGGIMGLYSIDKEDGYFENLNPNTKIMINVNKGVFIPSSLIDSTKYIYKFLIADHFDENYLEASIKKINSPDVMSRGRSISPSKPRL